MMKDLNDDDFLAAVIQFVKTTKEIYPGTNPIAILRELTREQLAIHLKSLPAPKKTEFEMQQIADMKETYLRIEKRGELERKRVADKREILKNQAKELLSKIPKKSE
jgi:hypothetical protein